LIIHGTPQDDPTCGSGDVGYSKAWEKAIQEYNQFGLAATSPKERIDPVTSKTMFGFKVSLFDKTS